MTVRKRYSKFYYTDFYVKGKRIVRKIPAGIADKRQAQIYEDDLKLKMLKGEIGLERKATDHELKPLIDQYLDYSRVNKAPSSFKRDELAIRTFIEHTGFTTLSDVTPIALERYKGERLLKVSRTTVNIELKILKAMFNKLVALEVISRNPIKSVSRLPGPSSNTIKFLEKDEVVALLEAASPSFRPILYTYLKTGLRKSELIHLEWTDIDLSNKRIRVIEKESHSVKWHRERHIPIDQELVDVLRSLRRQGKYVFMTRNETLRKNNLIRELKKTAVRAGIDKNVTIHMLRHTYASHLVMEGVPLRTVGELLGHSCITTTLRYSHLAPDHLNGAVEKLPF